MDIAVLALEGVFDSGIAAVLDVIQGANDMRAELAQPPPAWRITTVGFGQTARTGAGHIVATVPIDKADDADLIVMPAIAERRPDELLQHVSGAACANAREWLADANQRGRPLASACTGTFLLAESGVLNGRQATTSWWLAPFFRQRYPLVTLDMTNMVTTSRGITTAGAAFGHVDLALAIVRMRSPKLAELVSRYLVVDDRPSQVAYAIPSVLAQSDPIVSAFEAWARAHLDQPFSLSTAVRELGISERTLQRAVSRTLGTSPVRFVQDLRVEQASHLLRTTDLTIDKIARRVGYENGNTLQVLLRERTGATAGSVRRAKTR